MKLFVAGNPTGPFGNCDLYATEDDGATWDALRNDIDSFGRDYTNGLVGPWFAVSEDRAYLVHKRLGTGSPGNLTLVDLVTGGDLKYKGAIVGAGGFYNGTLIAKHNDLDDLRVGVQAFIESPSGFNRCSMNVVTGMVSAASAALVTTNYGLRPDPSITTNYRVGGGGGIIIQSVCRRDGTFFTTYPKPNFMDYPRGVLKHVADNFLAANEIATYTANLMLCGAMDDDTTIYFDSTGSTGRIWTIASGGTAPVLQLSIPSFFTAGGMGATFSDLENTLYVFAAGTLVKVNTLDWTYVTLPPPPGLVSYAGIYGIPSLPPEPPTNYCFWTDLVKAEQSACVMP